MHYMLLLLFNKPSTHVYTGLLHIQYTPTTHFAPILLISDRQTLLKNLSPVDPENQAFDIFTFFHSCHCVSSVYADAIH